MTRWVSSKWVVSEFCWYPRIMGSDSHTAPIRWRDRWRLRVLVKQAGEHGASAVVGVKRPTLARCLAGLPVQPQAHVAIRKGLELELRRDPSKKVISILLVMSSLA